MKLQKPQSGIKTRLMTSIYVLQSVRAKFNQYSVERGPACLLCGKNSDSAEVSFRTVKMFYHNIMAWFESVAKGLIIYAMLYIANGPEC